MSVLSVRRILPHLIALCAVCCLAIVSGLLWLEWKERFPTIEPGIFFGRIQGIIVSDSDPVTRLYVESYAEGNKIFFAVLKDEWSPSFVALASRGEHGANFPVILSNGNHELKFIGSKVGSDRYAGVVTDLKTGDEGTWALWRLREGAAQNSEEELRNTQLRLSLWSEFDASESKRAAAQTKVSEQQIELKRLEMFVTKGESLRTKADEKYTEAVTELAAVEAQLKAKREEADKLQRKVELSQKVTKMGKLVSLSRESLDKDQRWVESMLRSESGEFSKGFHDEIQRAHAVADIKAQIEREKELIIRLRAELKAREPALPAEATISEKEG